MIDYIKATIDPSAFSSSVLSSLEWELAVNSNTGEIQRWRVHYFGAMKLKGYFQTNGELQRVVLSGSLHKHAQNGSNWKRFDYGQLLETLIDIVHYLQVVANLIRLENVEAGANTLTRFSGVDIIQGLFLHRTTPFEAMLTNRDIGVVAGKCDFRDKAYHKGNQYSREILASNDSKRLNPQHLIRWERHFVKMRDLNRMGVYNLADLADPSKLSLLRVHIENTLDEVLFVPQTEEAKKVIETVNPNWTNPRYFQALAKSNPQKFRRERKELNERMSVSGLNVWSEVSHAIRNELREACYPAQMDAKIAASWLRSIA